MRNMTTKAKTMIEQLIEVANKNLEAMDGMDEQQAFEYVKGLIDKATIVVGVYPDDAEPHGVGMHVIKGLREIQVVVASGEDAPFIINAVPCSALEQAMAAELKLGDGLLKSN